MPMAGLGRAWLLARGKVLSEETICTQCDLIVGTINACEHLRLVRFRLHLPGISDPLIMPAFDPTSASLGLDALSAFGIEQSSWYGRPREASSGRTVRL
jgi:hypothetical protein